MVSLLMYLCGFGLSNILLKPSECSPNSSAKLENFGRAGRVSTSAHALSESHSGDGLGILLGILVPPAMRCLHSFYSERIKCKNKYNTE